MSASEVISIIRLTAPEFAEVTDANITSMIPIVEPLVSKKKFGKLYNQALALLVCHKLKLAGYGEDSEFGSIADSIRVGSYTEGSRSISFGGFSMALLSADPELGQTLYGIQFISLRKKVIVPITIAGVDS